MLKELSLLSLLLSCENRKQTFYVLHCFSSFFAKSLTFPAFIMGRETFPVARGLEDPSESLGSLATGCLSGFVNGGSKGRFGVKFCWLFIFCCGALTFAANSLFDCFFMVTNVCFLPGGIMGFLGSNDGAGGGAEESICAGLTGGGAAVLLVLGVRTPCVLSFRKTSWHVTCWFIDLYTWDDLFLFLYGFSVAGGGMGGRTPG